MSSKRWRQTTSDDRSRTFVLKISRAIPTCCSAAKAAPPTFLRSRSSFANAHDSFSPRCRKSGDGRHPFANREEFLESSGDLYLGVCATLKSVESELERLTEVEEAPGFRTASAPSARDLKFMLESNASNMVFWLERRGIGAWTVHVAQTQKRPIQGCRTRRCAQHIPPGHADRRLVEFCMRWCSSRFRPRC